MSKQELQEQEDIQRDMAEYWAENYRWQYRQAFPAALKWRAKSESDYHLTRLGRWFYTFKALVCLILRRFHPHTWKDDKVDIGAFNFQSMDGFDNPGWAQSYDVLAVGYGIFKGWWYDIYNDANY